MAQDKREDILIRLTEVCGAVTGVAHAQRNDVNIAEQNLPAIVVMDADEETDESELAEEAAAPCLVHMTAVANVMAQDRLADLGTTLNVIRAGLIKAVLTDAQLLALAGSGGGRSTGNVKYLGCDGPMMVAEGRAFQGHLGLRFRFSYLLRPDDLS